MEEPLTGSYSARVNDCLKEGELRNRLILTYLVFVVVFIVCSRADLSGSLDDSLRRCLGSPSLTIVY